MNQNKEIKNSKVRAAVYYRVSTEEQSKEGYGLEYQEERAKAFINSQDYGLDSQHIFKDAGYSGTLPIAERPALKRLFEAAERKEFDLVLVYRLDRFFRKSRLLLEAVEKLDSYGVGFKSISETFDTSNAMGRFMFQSLGAIAELERETIKERMMAGRIMAAKAGRWVLGQSPYGYKFDKKNCALKIIPEEAGWVKKFFEWLVNEQLSLTALTKRVNDLKIPTPSMNRKRKSKTSGYWHKRTINRMLVNETYGGTFLFRKYDSKRQVRPQEEWVPIRVPAIITPEMVELAKLQLQRNREFASRKSKLLYIFAKLVYCGVCGFKLFGAFHPPTKKSNSGSRYYRGVHKSASARRYVTNSQRCDWCGDIAESRLEPIWEAISNLLKNPAYTFDKLQRYMDRSVNKQKILERLDQIEKQVGSFEEKRQRADVLYSEVRRIDYAEYRRRLSEYERDERDLLQEKLQLTQSLENKSYRKERIKTLQILQKRIKKALENPSYEDKHRIIHLLVNKIAVWIGKNDAEVELNLPVIEDKNLTLEQLLRPQIRPQSLVLQDSRRR